MLSCFHFDHLIISYFLPGSTDEEDIPNADSSGPGTVVDDTDAPVTPDTAEVPGGILSRHIYTVCHLPYCFILLLSIWSSLHALPVHKC